MGSSKPAQLTTPHITHKIPFTFLNLNSVKSIDNWLDFQFDNRLINLLSPIQGEIGLICPGQRTR
jgi:hypothetical protein